MRKQRGFTLTELVAVIVILGILAVVAVPRMNTAGYRATEFHDRVVAALRYAQKTAVSHNRTVCVSFTNDSLALTIDHDRSGSCAGQALNLPGMNTNIVAGRGASFLSGHVDFVFRADGTGEDRRIAIAAQSDIEVWGKTGHVR